MKYRKRPVVPVVVEAFQWSADPILYQIPVWLMKRLGDADIRRSGEMYLRTTGPTLVVPPGSWLILRDEEIKVLSDESFKTEFEPIEG